MRFTRRQAFAIAAIIGVVVAGLVYYVLSRQTVEPVVTEPEQVTIVVAARDIPAFTTVTPEMLESREMAAVAAPPNVLSSPEQAIGQVSKMHISTGQTLTRATVGPRTAAAGLTFVIPRDHRAVTVALDPISGVGGFVYPGDRVDVLASFDNGGLSVTRTILQNIEVLAMNDITVRPRDDRVQQPTDTVDDETATEQVTSATLAVAPDQAQTLIMSAYKGAIHLVLRPRDDDSMVSLPEQTHRAVMGVDPPREVEEPAEPVPQMAMGWPEYWGAPPAPAAPQPEPAPPEEPAPQGVEIIRGAEREVVIPD